MDLSRVIRRIGPELAELPMQNQRTEAASPRSVRSAEELRGIFGELAQVIRGRETRYMLRGRAYYRSLLGLIELPFSVEANRVVTLR